MSGAPVVLAAAADRAYALPLAVVLRSADARLAPERALEVYVVDDGLSAEDRERIARPLSPRVRIEWRVPLRNRLGALPTWGRMPPTTYEKLTLPDWVPERHARVIWLDGDLVVLADLAPLFDLELGDAPLAAARDALVPTLGSRLGVAGWRELGLAPDAPYFNAGVLLLDLERFRRERLAEAALDYLARFRRRVSLWDQEALNAVLAGRWRELDPEWNWQPILSPLRHGERPSGSVRVAHFTGRLKPWAYRGLGTFQDAWRAELDATAWAGEQPPGGLARGAAVRYARWRGRRALLPFELLATVLQRTLTRRDLPPEPAPRDAAGT